MAQDLMNLQGFKGGGPSAAFKASINPDDNDRLSDGIGSSYGVLKYKGKVWSLLYNGAQHTFVKDDGYPLEYLDFIIVKQAKGKSKSYFPTYEEGASDAPLCTSIDGIIPDVGVPQKQAAACALCPRNVWKNSPDGKKVRECQDYKRIAVLLLPSLTAKLLGEPLREPVFLRIPGASLQGLAAMGDETERQGYPYFTYITRVDFDPAQSYPKMRFRAIQQLTDKEAPVVLPLRTDPISLRIVGLGEQRPQLAAPASAAVAPVQERVETGLLVPPQGTVAPPAGQQQAAVVIPPDQPKAPAPAVPTDIIIDIGLSAPQAAASTPAVAASDTGEATAADTELDARIAALMPS